MNMTKHAYARFKQRQKIKNPTEMMRRITLAIERGKLIEFGSSQPGTKCYEFAGFNYIVSGDMQTIITTYPSKVMSTGKRPLEEHRCLSQLCLNTAEACIQ